MQHHVLKHAVDVQTYAIHVLVCVLVFAQLNVRMAVLIAQILVDGGATLLAINNVLVLVRIDVLIHVMDLVRQS